MKLMPAWADMTTAGRVRRKLARLPEEQLVELADSIGSGMRQCLHEYHKGHASASLLEAEEGHVQMGCLLEELRERRP